MKTDIILQQSKKCIFFFFFGIILCTCSYLTYIFDPIRRIIDSKLQMGPNSLVASLWQKPPIDIFLNVYIFNITNADKFLNGEEKLKLQEVGPYVYKEELENLNVKWNDNGTVTYMPRRTVTFIREKSIGDPTIDRVIVPNVPLLGVSSALHNAGFIVNFPLIRLANFLGSKPILNITTHEYLWGYEDRLVRLAGGVVPHFINFKKFGLLDRMYDEGDNIVTMYVKKTKDMVSEDERYMSIEKMNGSPGLNHWGYVQTKGNETRSENTICNKIKGATEGVIFPPFINKNAVFRVFRKAFCRALPIKYVKDVYRQGLPGYLYKISDDFADPPKDNPDNECYCRKMSKCLKKGLSDLTPCYYNIPAAVSLPHFLDADPSLRDGIEGLNPDKEKHGTTVVLQPHLGIPMYVHSRLQTNLVMHHTQYNYKIASFNDMTIPLFWTDLEIPSLPTKLNLIVRLVAQVLPISQIIFIIILLISGLYSIVWSLVNTVMIVQHQQLQDEEDELQRLDESEVRIPLTYGQYTAIRIIPTIKKITSKSDLFS